MHLFIFSIEKMFCLHKTTSAVSCVKPNASQWEATLRDDVGFATVYRRIYRRKFLTLSNQTSRYIRECIRMLDEWQLIICNILWHLVNTVCSGLSVPIITWHNYSLSMLWVLIWFLALWVKFSAADILKYFSYFPRKQILTFHANCLQWRQFAWNVKSCFLGKIIKASSFCHLLSLPIEW